MIFQPFSNKLHLYKKQTYENHNSKTMSRKLERNDTNKLGRHCAVCSKTVRDFTDCTYEEIYKELNSNKNICGRFNAHQLNVNLRFLALKSFALGFLITGATVYAQKVTGDDLNKIDLTEGISSVNTFNKNVHRAMFLGMPSEELIENSQPLIYLDDKKITESQMIKLNRSNVEMVEILHGSEAEEKFGERGKEYGVILITSKKKEKRKKR